MSDPVPGQQIINDGAVLTDGDRIVAVGERNSVLSNLIAAKADQSIQESVDCGGGLLLPGLIDCHTHLVFAGDRAREFEQRLEGLSYEEISRQGGGIRSTVDCYSAEFGGDIACGCLQKSSPDVCEWRDHPGNQKRLRIESG